MFGIEETPKMQVARLYSTIDDALVNTVFWIVRHDSYEARL